MCDILLATPKATGEHMIFAKNSDREPNEAQVVEYIPRKKWEEGEVNLTYVKFPQVSQTYAIIISRPWWIWGAEMGVNEFGLAIGNTAVFTKEKKKDRGILGMDMIRLALERKRFAKEALDFIIEIIENYGQGGSGSYEHKFLYHNSFIIADKKEAYVLETAGKHWVVKKIDYVYSISNALTIGGDWDMASDSVESISKKKANFNFAKEFSDKFYTHFAHGRERRNFTYKMLKRMEGKIDLAYIMAILRSHGENFDPLNPSMGHVCMHYGGKIKPSQTASSHISILDSDIHFFTGESNPCLSIFKPFFFSFPWWIKEDDVNYKYNPSVFWWRAEKFHRKFIIEYGKYIDEFSRERDNIQGKIIDMSKNKGSDTTQMAFKMENDLIQRWMERIKINRIPWKYRRIWEKINRRADIQIQ